MSTLTHALLLVVPRPSLPPHRPTLPKPSLPRPSLPGPTLLRPSLPTPRTKDTFTVLFCVPLFVSMIILNGYGKRLEKKLIEFWEFDVRRGIGPPRSKRFDFRTVSFWTNIRGYDTI